MVRFDSVLNVTDLIRDAILLLLQQVDRYSPRVVGLQQFHSLVVETIALSRCSSLTQLRCRNGSCGQCREDLLGDRCIVVVPVRKSRNLHSLCRFTEAHRLPAGYIK